MSGSDGDQPLASVSEEASPRLFYKRARAFGIVEYVILNTDERTPLMFHYGLCHFATVNCACCGRALDAANMPVESIVEWIRYHMKIFQKPHSKQEAHDCSHLPHARALAKAIKASLDLEEHEFYRVPEGARPVILQEDEAREQFGELWEKLEARQKDACGRCLKLLKTKAPSKPTCCPSSVRLTLTFLQRTSNAGRMFCTPSANILQLQQEFLKGPAPAVHPSYAASRSKQSPPPPPPSSSFSHLPVLTQQSASSSSSTTRTPQSVVAIVEGRGSQVPSPVPFHLRDTPSSSSSIPPPPAFSSSSSAPFVSPQPAAGNVDEGTTLAKRARLVNDEPGLNVSSPTRLPSSSSSAPSPPSSNQVMSDYDDDLFDCGPASRREPAKIEPRSKQPATEQEKLLRLFNLPFAKRDEVMVELATRALLDVEATQESTRFWEMARLVEELLYKQCTLYFDEDILKHIVNVLPRTTMPAAAASVTIDSIQQADLNPRVYALNMFNPTPSEREHNRKLLAIGIKIMFLDTENPEHNKLREGLEDVNALGDDVEFEQLMRDGEKRERLLTIVANCFRRLSQSKKEKDVARFVAHYMMRQG